MAGDFPGQCSVNTQELPARLELGGEDEFEQELIGTN